MSNLLDEKWRNAIHRDDLQDERRERRAAAENESLRQGTGVRYRIVENSAGRWIIVHSTDDGLIWVGSHWSERWRSGHLLTFADQTAAVKYAKEVFEPSQVREKL